MIDFTGKKESERQTLSYTQNPGGAPANVVVAKTGWVPKQHLSEK